MISVAEASRRVGRTPHTIRRWMREGKLRSYRFGMHAMVDETDLARLLDRPTPVGSNGMEAYRNGRANARRAAGTSSLTGPAGGGPL
jgi:excisionase family DNA binding protein